MLRANEMARLLVALMWTLVVVTGVAQTPVPERERTEQRS